MADKNRPVDYDLGRMRPMTKSPSPKPYSDIISRAAPFKDTMGGVPFSTRRPVSHADETHTSVGIVDTRSKSKSSYSEDRRHGRKKRPAIRNQRQIIAHAGAMIIAIDEALSYRTTSNQPRPALFADNAEYLQELRSLRTELQRLNHILERVRPQKNEVKKISSALSRHANTAANVFAKTVGVGGAALAISTLGGLLESVGVPTGSLCAHLKSLR